MCIELGIGTVTFFVLSKENILRNINEINNLTSILSFCLGHFINRAFEKNIKVNILGDTKNLKSSLINKFRKIEVDTQHHTKLILNLAIDYGGRWDIIQSTQNLVDMTLKQEIKDNLITEQIFQNYTMLRNQISPDILIRTGGYKRLSNFFLWDIAYTEIFFLEKLWPDINLEDIKKVINEYQKTTINYGK